MGGNVGASIDEAGYLVFRKRGSISQRKQPQIRGRSLQLRCDRALSIALNTVTRSAVTQIHDSASCYLVGSSGRRGQEKSR
jgi:hypothetical protein